MMTITKSIHMKKWIWFIWLLLTPNLSFGAGIPVTDIPRFIMEFITNEILMEQDKKVQGDKLQKLVEVLVEAKQIRARHTELQGMEDDLETELRLVWQVQELQLHDVLRIVQKVISVSNSLYAHQMPYLEEYALLQKNIPGLASVEGMYDFMLGGTSVYGEMTGQAPVTYQANTELIRQQAIKQYGLEVDAAKRALHTAISYGQLSEDFRDQAEDLQEKVNREGNWSIQGLGDLFSDLLDAGGEAVGLEDLFGLEDKVEEWAGDIREKVGLGGMDNLFGGGEDKSDQIKDAVEEAVGGFDFLSLFQSVTGLLGGSGYSPLAGYSVEFAKDGMRMTTGERIEAQGIVIDNLEQSVELGLEADRLILEALEKSEHQQKVDATYRNGLIRQSLMSIPVNP